MFDHFDTEIQAEETLAYQEYLAAQEFEYDEEPHPHHEACDYNAIIEFQSRFDSERDQDFNAS